MSQNNHLISKLIFILIVFSFFLNLLNAHAVEEEFFGHPGVNCCCPSQEDLVTIETFPLDLDRLFWVDNLTKQNEIMNYIGNESGGWLLSPWGGFFTSGHIEGADKWYFEPRRLVSIYAPHDGILEELRNPNGTSGIMNGSEVVYDCCLTIKIGEKCCIRFGHIAILKTIFDEIESNGGYSFSEGELLGYPTYYGNYEGGTEMYYLYNYESICPFPALSPSLQSKVMSYYNLQYERMKLSGRYPQSRICTNTSIDIENSYWGVWSYYTGPYNSYYEGLEDFGFYKMSFLTLFRREFANPETYWRDINYPERNLTSDILGIFGDNMVAEDIPGYTPLTIGHIRQIEGDQSQGILNLSLFGESPDYPKGTSFYARFRVNPRTEGFIDDLLTFESFENLSAAQQGFTAKNITYQRVLVDFQTNSEVIAINLFLVAPPGLLFILTLALLKKRSSEKRC